MKIFKSIFIIFALLIFISCTSKSSSDKPSESENPTENQDNSTTEKYNNESSTEQTAEVSCPACNGMGQISGHICPGCNGSGGVTQELADKISKMLGQLQQNGYVDGQQNSSQSGTNENRNSGGPEKEKWMVCPMCNGAESCPVCHGQGGTYDNNLEIRRICSACGGTGKCPNCYGHGLVQESN
jgi:DnaJ-class molecular chaperone